MSTYATDFDATKTFYSAILAELDFSVQAEIVFDADTDLPDRRACAFGPNGRPVFWIVEILEAYTPRHVAFTAPDRERVISFRAAGLLVGGRDIDAPGPPPIYHENYYGAFLADPDGNNVEAVCHVPPS